MSENIKQLLELVDSYPKIGMLDYNNDDHRRFCNMVLLAAKRAAPEIKTLAEANSKPPITPKNRA